MAADDYAWPRYAADHVQRLTSELADTRRDLAAHRELTARRGRELAETTVRLRKAEAERDAAIAHDRQPYPTADSFDAACWALATYRALADEATAALVRSSLAAGEAEQLRRRFEAAVPARQSTASLAEQLTAARDELEAAREVVAMARAWRSAFNPVTDQNRRQFRNDELALIEAVDGLCSCWTYSDGAGVVERTPDPECPAHSGKAA